MCRKFRLFENCHFCANCRMLSVVILEECAIFCMLFESYAEVLGEKCLIQLHTLKFVIHEFFREAMCVVSFSTVSNLCFINLKYTVYLENKTKLVHENYSEKFCSVLYENQKTNRTKFCKLIFP